MEATIIVCWGCIGIMENKLETSIVGVLGHPMEAESNPGALSL